MPHHAYIDESGTMDHQGVMSVAMIILEGAHSAQRLHDHVMTALNPKYIQLVKRLKKERKPAHEMPYLHFADMSVEQKRTVGARLADAKVTVFTAHHRHRGDKAHPERFEIYTELVKICVRRAFENHKELVIAIAKQGGWQKYERHFCAGLRALPEEFTQRGIYRRAEFELLSAVKPGIQLADFYVGAVREFTMDDSAVMPFDLVREQIISHEIYALEPVESER